MYCICIYKRSTKLYHGNDGEGEMEEAKAREQKGGDTKLLSPIFLFIYQLTPNTTSY